MTKNSVLIGIAIGFVIGASVSELLWLPTLSEVQTRQFKSQVTFASSDFDEAELVSPSSLDQNLVDAGYLFNGTDIFRETARSFQPITDKVTTHEYEIMYGSNLLPYYYKNPEMKMLEIGLGCGMNYGPGASARLWKALFPKAELWEAEFNAECVKKNKNTSLAGFNTLVGDQGNPEVLGQWINESGGDFDVIIDDGGHTNCQIWTTFEKLWPTVKRGGLYFIEDMQLAKWPSYRKSTRFCNGTNLTVPDKLKEMLDRLMYEDNKILRRKHGEEHTGDVQFLFCQPEACVLKKKVSNADAPKSRGYQMVKPVDKSVPYFASTFEEQENLTEAILDGEPPGVVCTRSPLCMFRTRTKCSQSIQIQPFVWFSDSDAGGPGASTLEKCKERKKSWGDFCSSGDESIDMFFDSCKNQTYDCDPNQPSFAFKRFTKKGQGFFNQQMAFTGSVIALNDHVHMSDKYGDYYQILLPSLKFIDYLGSDEDVSFDQLYDVDHWNTYVPRLPRIVSYNNASCRHPYFFEQSSEGFQLYFVNYMSKLEDGTRSELDPVDRLILQDALRPSPKVQSVVDSVVQDGAYAAVHLRFEQDYLCYGWAVQDRNLTIVLNKIESAFGDNPPFSRIFFAINRMHLEDASKMPNKPHPSLEACQAERLDNLAALNRAASRGMWNGKVQVFERPQQLPESFQQRPVIFGSHIDSEICNSAKVFLGRFTSTFTKNIIRRRLMKGKSENYNYEAGFHKMQGQIWPKPVQATVHDSQNENKQTVGAHEGQER